MTVSADTPRRVDDIEWSTWRPTDPATLVFIRRDDEVLLIRKKRGLGAGKINGPGGRLDPGETPLECAIREVQEELRVTPLGVELRGEHFFQFVDGYSIHVLVYSADGCDGEPEETEEAIPIWTSVDEIPYDEMWADDRLWIPHLLAATPFSGRYLFDGDQMLDHHIVTGHDLCFTSFEAEERE